MLCCFNVTTSQSNKYEKHHQFIWDDSLYLYVNKTYSDHLKFYNRLAQTFCESGFYPLSTSDYGGWKKAKIDTITALKNNKGAAGLCQFIWGTAIMYQCKSISTSQAYSKKYVNDIYNPLWSLNSMCKYMHNIDLYLLKTKNNKVRRELLIERDFAELCATASYNCGQGRVMKQLNKNNSWTLIKMSLPVESKNYAEKIQNISEDMRKQSRWRKYNGR